MTINPHSLSTQTLCFLSLLSFSLGDDQSLISTIKNSSFGTMELRHTGTEFEVPLPSNLTALGVEATAIRLRSSTFWQQGANLTSFHIPPGIFPNPFRKRLLFISYNLGHNLSASLYSGHVTAGYSLVSSVLGLIAYDASDNERDIEVAAKDDEFITIEFPAVDSLTVMYCARFGEAGEYSLDGEEVHGMCSTKGLGRFGLVALISGKEKNWRKWVVVGLGGVVGASLLVFGVGIWVLRLVRRKRVSEMRAEADAGEVLEFMWIDGRKLPCAGLTRTAPVIDNNFSPSL